MMESSACDAICYSFSCFFRLLAPRQQISKSSRQGAIIIASADAVEDQKTRGSMQTSAFCISVATSLGSIWIENGHHEFKKIKPY